MTSDTFAREILNLYTRCSGDELTKIEPTRKCLESATISLLPVIITQFFGSSGRSSARQWPISDDCFVLYVYNSIRLYAASGLNVWG